MEVSGRGISTLYYIIEFGNQVLEVASTPLNPTLIEELPSVMASN